MSKFIFFVAQTGTTLFKKPKAPTNYYMYRLPIHLLGTLELKLETHQQFENGSLTYTKEFLEWLEKNDTK